MKQLAALFLILLLQPMLAATRTSSQSGNWDNNATWGGSAFPVSGDVANINGDHVITIPLGVSVAALQVLIGQTVNVTNISTLIINGSLTMDSSSLLKCGGNFTNRDAKIVMGPGGSIALPTSFAMNNGIWLSTATRSSPFTITGAGGITATAGSRQYIDISNIKFLETGVFSLAVGNTTGSMTNYLRITNCTFVGINGVTLGSTTTGTDSTVPMIFDNNDLREFSTGKTIVMQRVDGGSAAFEFRHNTIFQTAGLFEIKPQISKGLLVADNVMVNGQITQASPGGGIVSNNFNASSRCVMISSAAPTTITLNYMVGIADNRNGFGTTGAAGSGVTTISSNIFDTIVDAVWTGRPDMYVPNTTPLSTDFVHNLLIGAGETMAMVGGVNLLTMNLKNNTTCVTVAAAVDSGGALFVEEIAPKTTGLLQIANNLYRGNNHAASLVLIGSPMGNAAEIVDYSDYNNFVDVNLAYDSRTNLVISTGNTSKIVPGSHDKAAEPNFYDTNRNCATWNFLYGGGVQTQTNCMTYMLGINGYRGTPNFDQQGTISQNGPYELSAWVRQGYYSTNPAFRAAGDPSDGSPDIGFGYLGLKGAIGYFFGAQ